MQGFPGRTIILMDIDCDVIGPIYPVLECATDISLFIGVGIDPRREEGLRVRALPSSRIIVWRPTAGARRLLDTWEALCQEQITSPILNDEQLLMQAIGATAGLTLTVIDPRYAARNPWDHPPGAVIVHQTDPITRTCGPGRLLRAET
jgi:hypothetical protein